MKMTKEDFDELKIRIDKVLAHPKCPLFSLYKERGLSEKRYRYDLFWAARQFDETKNMWRYSYLNDDNIYTALKKLIPIDGE